MLHNKEFFLKYKLQHVLFWLLVIPIWAYLRQQDYATEEIALQVTILKVVDLALMIYFASYVLVPRLLYHKKYVWFAVAFISMILLSSTSKVFFISRITNHPELFSLSGDLKIKIYDNVIPHFFLVIAGVSFKLMADYGKVQRKLGEMAKEKAETELNFLKSQINPHFLFNSINSVYFLINKDNIEARQALHKFSDMLRYQLYEMSGDKIPVEKEINYLKDYIDLQKLRKDENYSVEFSCAPEVKGFSIEPLLLIPLVENAFKHISHYKDKTNFIRFDMSRSNGEFRFVVKNSKEETVKTTEKDGGIGLTNVKRRLDLMYPEGHKLVITNENDLFVVDLKLKIVSGE